MAAQLWNWLEETKLAWRKEHQNHTGRGCQRNLIVNIYSEVGRSGRRKASGNMVTRCKVRCPVHFAKHGTRGAAPFIFSNGIRLKQFRRNVFPPNCDNAATRCVALGNSGFPVGVLQHICTPCFVLPAAHTSPCALLRLCAEPHVPPTLF